MMHNERQREAIQRKAKAGKERIEKLRAIISSEKLVVQNCHKRIETCERAIERCEADIETEEATLAYLREEYKRMSANGKGDTS